MKPNKIYTRAKIERHNDVLTDLEGNFNLMKASPRALRLLDYIIWKRATT